MGDKPVARPLPTHRTTQQNKRTETSMPKLGVEPTISVFELAKTVHALDRAATVIGTIKTYKTNFASCFYSCEVWSVTVRKMYGPRAGCEVLTAVYMIKGKQETLGRTDRLLSFDTKQVA
jgi:hypothetical protein